MPRDFGSFYRVSVQVLRQNVVLRDRCRRSDGFGGSKHELTWQNRTLFENRGRHNIFWTLPKLWQACVIRRIAFYVAGAGNPDHGCYVLRSKGSIPKKGCIFGTWTWGSICVASAAFRTTSGHDFVAGAVLRRKRSFWKSGSSVFEEVSQKTLVLEV